MYSKPFKGNFRITSGFGPRGNGFHDGIDFGCPKGTAIYAIADGKVIVSQQDQHGGNWIDIQLNNGMIARYLHFIQRLVQVGDRVKSGQLIGYSGGVPGEFGSGLSTGAHLHLAVKRNGRFFNWYPELWPQMKEPNQQNMPQQNFTAQFTEKEWAAWKQILDNAKADASWVKLDPKTQAVVNDTPLYAVVDLVQRVVERDQWISDLQYEVEQLKKQN